MEFEQIYGWALLISFLMLLFVWLPWIVFMALREWRIDIEELNKSRRDSK